MSVYTNASKYSLDLVLTREGVIPNPAKIEALKNLPEPKNENLVAKLAIGIVNYLSQFMTHR